RGVDGRAGVGLAGGGRRAVGVTSVRVVVDRHERRHFEEVRDHAVYAVDASDRHVSRLQAASRTQSDEERITMPSPQYDQNCRLVRNRCGVTTTGTSCAARIGPIAGHVASCLVIACRRASVRSSFSARLRISWSASYWAKSVNAAARVPSGSWLTYSWRSSAR